MTITGVAASWIFEESVSNAVVVVFTALGTSFSVVAEFSIFSKLLKSFKFFIFS